ncbi:MAG: hypothetical protein ACT6Q5_16230 [Sphingopyxis solisilvae]|uniref:hypothetical protein n=1 Tax=Sphingopyxis solisilvae TaxID=1886788 RepID=UPI004035AA72
MAIEWGPLLIGAAIGSVGSLAISWGFYIKAKQDSAAAANKLSAAIADATKDKGTLSPNVIANLVSNVFETKAGKEIGGRVLAKALGLYDQATKARDAPSLPEPTPPAS